MKITITAAYSGTAKYMKEIAFNPSNYSATFFQGNMTAAGAAGSCNWTTSGVNLYETCATNVGIGTSTPAETLQVSGKVLLGDNTSTSGGVAMLEVNQSNATASAGSYTLQLIGQGANQFVVQGNGNVGIGTSAPQYLLM